MYTITIQNNNKTKLPDNLREVARQIELNDHDYNLDGDGRWNIEGHGIADVVIADVTLKSGHKIKVLVHRLENVYGEIETKDEAIERYLKENGIIEWKDIEVIYKPKKNETL